MAVRTMIALAGAVACLALMVSSAEAATRPRGGGGAGSVTSCSRYGNGCITLATRSGRNGTEYRTPGGSWIDCRLDCREAIREDVVDFWETLREKSPSTSH